MVVNTFLVNTVLQAALLAYGARLCLKEGMHPQVLIAFMLYQGQLQEYTANLVNSLSNLIKSTGCVQGERWTRGASVAPALVLPGRQCEKAAS